jgi:hypothetical protein
MSVIINSSYHSSRKQEKKSLCNLFAKRGFDSDASVSTTSSLTTVRMSNQSPPKPTIFAFFGSLTPESLRSLRSNPAEFLPTINSSVMNGGTITEDMLLNQLLFAYDHYVVGPNDGHNLVGADAAVAPIDASLPNEGTLPNEVTLPNDGTLSNDGTLPNYGALPNDGSLQSDGSSPGGVPSVVGSTAETVSTLSLGSAPGLAHAMSLTVPSTGTSTTGTTTEQPH